MKKRNEILVLILSLYVFCRINIKTDYDKIIKNISENYDNNPDLIKAIIRVESNFNPKAHNLTAKEDSRGLMQINKNTAFSLGVNDLNKLFNPEYNILIGNKLIVDLEKRYKNTLDIICAYNAGRVIKTKYGQYRNSEYVFRVYSYYLAYSILNI